MCTAPGFETREIGPHEENGETWHRLLVKYPPSIPTHCAEQVLYFNAQGLLQRMDYSVDVVGDMVAGAASHYCFDHTPFGGIVIPTLRRAVSRTPKGAVLSGPTGVLLQMSDIKLIPNAPKEGSNDRLGWAIPRNYPIVLRQRPKGLWLDLQLNLWRVLDQTIQATADANPL